MSVIFLLIPLSIVLAACFLGAFIWAVRSGQYEDTCTPSMRVLLDETVAGSTGCQPVPSGNLPDGTAGRSDIIGDFRNGYVASHSGRQVADRDGLVARPTQTKPSPSNGRLRQSLTPIISEP